MNFKRIVISTLLIASVTSATSCDSSFFAKKTSTPQSNAKPMVYAPELDPNVHELITDQRFKSLGSDDELRFETAVTPDEAASGTPVELHDSNGNKISKMYDDGTHSDRIAGDGIYTCSYKPNPEGEENYSYTAKIGDTETEPASVRYFDNISNKDIEDMNEVGERISEIKSQYLDSEGNIPEDKKEEVLNEVTEYAKELYNNGEAIEYRVNDDSENVVVKLNSGITMVYANPTTDVEDGSSGSGDIQTAVNWAINIANDDTHGYSQANRNGNPDYDCSSLVIAAMKEGNFNVGAASYTGNMKKEFTNNDFTWIDWNTLGGVNNLQYGDVLLKDGHTELYIGNGQRVGAHSNYDGKAGDGAGNEISIKECSSTETWKGVLRCKYSSSSSPDNGNSSSNSNSDPMQIAVNWAIGIANDDTHGYEYGHKGDPDYDCSALVLAAMKQGGINIGGASSTKDMQEKFTKGDFIWIDWDTLGGVDNLQYGDVLLNIGHHTELYIGNGQRVGAHQNYDRKTGDGAGDEISIKECQKGSRWDGVLRYKYGNYSNGSSGNSSSDASSNKTNTQNQNQNISIKVLKPFNSSSPSIGENLSDTVDLISSEFSENVTGNSILTDSNVTPHSIESFGPNQIIIWRGKGGYDGRLHSFLYTTRPFNPSDYTIDDIIEERVIVDFSQNRYGKARVCITSKYIDAHCPDMTNSFVFLGFCCGAKDSVLSASFINKNCNVVLGFSETINISYDNNIMYGLINEMCKKRVSNVTGEPSDYCTIEEALETVKSLYGAENKVKRINAYSIAKPILFGNRNYRFIEIIEKTINNANKNNVSVSGSLQLEDTYISVSKGQKAGIKLHSLPNGYKESDLTWTTDNKDVATVKKGVVKGIETGYTSVTVATKDGLFKQQCFVNVRE